MKPLLLLLLLASSFTTQAQDIVSAELPDDAIYNTSGVEVKPEFVGGIEAFYKYIGKKYRVPKKRGLGGKVFVSFIVDKDGSLTDIKVIRDIGYGTGEEAVRVLSKCPKWIPGQQHGRAVRVLYSLPINIIAR